MRFCTMNDPSGSLSQTQQSKASEPQNSSEIIIIDKSIYQNFAHEFLRSRIPGVPEERLRTIEKYIAETLVLSQDKLTGLQRFVVGLSSRQTVPPVGVAGMYDRYHILIIGQFVPHLLQFTQLIICLLC